MGILPAGTSRSDANSKSPIRDKKTNAGQDARARGQDAREPSADETSALRRAEPRPKGPMAALRKADVFVTETLISCPRGFALITSPAMKTMSHLNRREFVRNMTVAASALGATTSLSPASQAPATTPITVALVGCAHIHTPGFVNLMKGRTEVKVKYVWDHDPARAKKRAGDLQTATTSNLDDIWKDEEIKAVVICSETNRHLDLVSQAANAGKHMFVEKPLGTTAADSYKMAKAIEAAKVLFTTGYFQRCQSNHLFLKEQISKGNFGKITRVIGSNCHSGSLSKWFDTEWRWIPIQRSPASAPLAISVRIPSISSCG